LHDVIPSIRPITRYGPAVRKRPIEMVDRSHPSPTPFYRRIAICQCRGWPSASPNAGSGRGTRRNPAIGDPINSYSPGIPRWTWRQFACLHTEDSRNSPNSPNSPGLGLVAEWCHGCASCGHAGDIGERQTAERRGVDPTSSDRAGEQVSALRQRLMACKLPEMSIGESSS
jgi:hypothetical protein